MSETELDLAALFTPLAAREIRRVRENGVRFVHYTSAETAMKILRGKEMWLRNSTLMNDFSEVQYGLDCLVSAWNGEAGERLKKVLREVDPELPDQFIAHFDAQLLDVRAETYLVSISEHAGGLEDIYGRLSMWRAYAPRNGVAFIFNNRPFVSETDALNAFTSPVNYATKESFAKDLLEVAEGMEKGIDTWKEHGSDWLRETLLTTLRFAIQSTKHPSFAEEQEWRVIYSPHALERTGMLTEQQMERIPTEIICLGGVPQRIYKIPFKNYPDEGFEGATIPELIDRVLIGPSPDSYMIHQAIVAELTQAGVANAGEKVIVTGVPLKV